MFAKIFAIFALIAVAFGAPNPKPEPQYLAYSGLDYLSPYSAAVPVSSVVQPYAAAPLAYSGYPYYSGAAVYLR